MGSDGGWKNIHSRIRWNVHGPRRALLDERDGSGRAIRKCGYCPECEDVGSMGYISRRKPIADSIDEGLQVSDFCLLRHRRLALEANLGEPVQPEHSKTGRH